jgi:hypothetical protein
VEGGQNEHPSTVDHHEAAIWLTMDSLGLFPNQDLPQLARSRGSLASSSACALDFIEVRFRQVVLDGQGFWMERGFNHIHNIEEGRLLAHIERDGERVALHAHLDGVLLMPRYQGQGNDGYFIGRRVRPRWLTLSRILRRLPLHWILFCFRALRRDPERERQLLVDSRRQGALLAQLLGLFGYRMCSSHGDRLVYLRRPQ